MNRGFPSTAAGTKSTRHDWLTEAEFPFVIRELAIGEHRINYVDEGTGPTMLFVHAGPAWSFLWRDLIVRLSDEFRCIALDFPGSGLSPATAGYRPTIETAAAILEEFVEALDLRDISMITDDVGTPVGLGAAIRLPDRFVSFAVTEGFAWSLADENPAIARMLRIVGSRPVGLLNIAFNLLARVTASSAGAGRNLTVEGKRAFMGPYQDRAVRRNAAAMLLDAVAARTYLRRLDSLLVATLGDLPVFLVFGSKSPTVKEMFPDRWAKSFPNARLVMVEGGHHFPMNDDPDLVAVALRRWWHEAVERTPSADLRVRFGQAG